MITCALLVALAASPEMPNAAPGWERGARTRSSEPDIDGEERYVSHVQVGAAIGAGTTVVASIVGALIYEAHLNATVPPEDRNPDGHVTPLLIALSAIPMTAIVGGGVGAAIGFGVAALGDTGAAAADRGAE